jgi:hypothetical protein
MDKFKHKLSTHHGVENARIWLEGARLVEAGFTVGARFSVEWTAATLTLTRVKPFEGRKAGFGTVSGKGDKPIIDIVGPRVLDTFGKHSDHASVTYTAGVIVVRRAG